MMQEKIDQLKVLILRAVCAGIDYGAAKDDQLNTRLAALHAAEAEVDAKLQELTCEQPSS